MNTYLDIPDEYLTALGAVSANMAKLEFGITMCISMLITERFVARDFKQTVCLVGGETFEVLVSKLNKLYRLKVLNPEQLQEFDVILKRLDHIGKMRIKYIHSMILHEETTTTRLKFKKYMSNDGSLHETGKISIPELREFVKEVTSVGEDVFSLVNTFLPETQKQYEESRTKT